MKNLLFMMMIVAVNTVALVSCSKDDPAPMPQAEFSISGGDCISPCKVYFSNESKNAVSYIWDFGDGGVSTDEHPIHTYDIGGNYIVKLTAKSGTGEITTTETVNITPDKREQALGNYTYTSATYQHDTLYKTETGRLSISRDSEDTEAINVDWDGTKILANKIQKASNGFVFDIRSWKETNSYGDSYEIRGIKSADLVKSEYHGFYDSAEKEISFKLYLDYDNDYYDEYNVTIIVTATKNN